MSSLDKFASSIRPRRSVLYVPGSNTRALEKARKLAADVVIIDLEDAVSPSSKDAARLNASRALAEDFGHREVVVRINGLQTPWGHDDAEQLMPLRPAAILLPKVDSAAQVQDLAAVMHHADPTADVKIWAMVETAAAFFRLPEIVDSHPQLQALVVGTTDLVTELRGRHTVDRASLLSLLSLVVCAARSRRLAVIDGVHLRVDDESVLRITCEQGRDLGFDGKSLIHPFQIGPANAVYGPSLDALSHARQVLATYEAALKSGSGVGVLDGVLVEALHVQEAQRVLEMAEAIENRSN